jgi:bacillithiol synthase
MPYKKSKISLSEAGHFPQLLLDYLQEGKPLRNFYTYTPDLSSFKDAIRDRGSKSIDRKLLAEVILGQYQGKINAPLSDFQATNSNIELLEDKNTFTVCTGHQLCLFTGPLYFIYKIISTINLAETLKNKYPDKHFVPVYWMASEDHDFEEIASVHLFGKTLRWDLDSAKGAVGRLNTSSLHKIIDELKTIAGDSENAKELISLFETAYLKHPNLADATRYLVHELFGTYGLVIVDADDKRLKESFVDIIKDDILNHTNFRLVNDSIKLLENAGYKAQVNPREINVFQLNDDRTRIESNRKEYLELKADEYSPNVVLRPLYQQRILPNIAYVGGPGEISYWLEYKAMFDHHNITFPVLIPRNFALLADEKTVHQLEKFNFSAKDLFEDSGVLIKKFITQNSDVELSLEPESVKLAFVYAEISGKVTAIDPSLKASVEAEMQKALNAMKNIEVKLLRSEKQKQETSINQIRKLKEKLFPEEILQERYDNFIPYYLKYGRSFISSLKESFDPFEFEMLIIEMN